MHYVNIGHFHQTLLSFIHHLIPFCLKECDTLFTLKWLPQAISCSIKKYLPTFVIFFTNPYPVVSIGNHWLIHSKTIVAYFMFFLILIFFFNKNAINHSFTFETKVVYLINCFPASTPQTPLLRLYVAPPRFSYWILDFATGTTIYIVWKRCGGWEGKMKTACYCFNRLTVGLLL